MKQLAGHASRRAAVTARLTRRLLSTQTAGPSVSQRLAALSKLQEKTDELAAEAEKEQLNVRRRLLAQTAELRDRRAAILAGDQLTDDESALEPVEDADVPPSLESSLETYWQEVLQRVLGRRDVSDEFAHNWLTADDLKILAHLRDIQISCVAGTDGSAPHKLGQGGDDVMTLTFFFRPNEYMEPGHETVSIEYARTIGQLQSTPGCHIQWRPGKDPTRIGGLNGTQLEVSSFFSIFARCAMLSLVHAAACMCLVHAAEAPLRMQHLRLMQHVRLM